LSNQNTFRPKAVKAIFFDVDGTLRNTDDHYAARFQRWLRPFARWLPNQDANAAARRMVMRLEKPGNDALGLADRLGVDGHLSRLAEFAAARRKPQAGEFAAIPDVVAAVELLAARLPLAVITVRGATATNAFLQEARLREHFKLVVSGQTMPRTKPFPDQLLHACREFGLEPAECVMVGDTTPDMLAAAAAGVQAIGVLSGFGEEDELRAAGAQLILPSVAELPAALALA
jgi:phosphoglycolate phosphatase-like HAD superfamily hydrolase